MITTYLCVVIDRRTHEELANYEIEIDSRYQCEAHARRSAAANFRKFAPNAHEADWFLRSSRKMK
jgi:hypothetical protein